MNKAKIVPVLISLMALSLLVGCGKASQTAGVASGKATETTVVQLSDKESDNIVRRSYQYVAMFNVIQKFPLDPSSAMFTDGFNRPIAMTGLTDHTMKSFGSKSRRGQRSKDERPTSNIELPTKGKASDQ